MTSETPINTICIDGGPVNKRKNRRKKNTEIKNENRRWKSGENILIISRRQMKLKSLFVRYRIFIYAYTPISRRYDTIQSPTQNTKKKEKKNKKK